LYNGRSFSYGKPYYASFDKTNGTQKYMKIFQWEKNPLLYYITSKDSIDMIFKDQTKRFSLQSGDCRTIMYDTLSYGCFKYTVSREKVYLKKDSTFERLSENDPKAFYLMSSKNKIIKLERNMNIENTISLDNTYTLKASTKEYKFLKNDNKTIIISDNKQAIAELNLSKNMFVFKNKLYSIDNHSIYEIDLTKELSN
jgi:hypothetical protein